MFLGSSAELKAPSEFRFIGFNGSKGVSLYQVVDGKLQGQERIVHFTGYWYISGANPALSPNGRWIYLPLHADTALIDLQMKKLYWLGRARRLPEGGYTAEVYPLRWSPDSRYLLGHSAPQGRDLILCTPLRQGYRVLVEDEVYGYGWYPDSRHIWYVQKSRGGRLEWYRLNVVSRQRERLGTSERNRIYRDWDLTLAPFRREDYRLIWRQLTREVTEAELTATMALVACTVDRQVRVRHAIPPPQLAPIEWGRQAIIEWRSGRSVLLASPAPKSRIWVWDISASKQWALVARDAQWYVVDVGNGRWQQVTFSEEVTQLFRSDVNVWLRAEFVSSA